MAVDDGPAVSCGKTIMPLETIVSPRFEMCYALADLVSPDPRLGWELAPVGRAQPDWLKQAALYGWGFWLAVPDILENAEPSRSVGEVIEALKKVPPERARTNLIDGLFHQESDSRTVEARKREWLAFIGLDEWAGKSATGAALKKESAALMSGTLAILEDFARIFEPVWEGMLPQLEESRQRAERLCRACSLGEIAQQLMLRVEVDEAAHRVLALRGGFEMDYTEETRIYLLPSAVNFRRFWTVADAALPATIFFPYFDPSISISDLRVKKVSHTAPDLDPWLICRALGDPTRAAIIRRLAKAPSTAVELGADLGLSKANMSHHIFQLREAGLLHERPKGRAVELSIRKDTIVRLSDAFRAELKLS